MTRQPDFLHYALQIQHQLPEIEKWKDRIESFLAQVPDEHREQARQYLREMYQRTLVAKRARRAVA